MPRRCLLTVLCFLALAGATAIILHHQRQKEGGKFTITSHDCIGDEPLHLDLSLPSPSQKDDLDPLLNVLLQQPVKNDHEQKSPFFKALLSLARQHGAYPKSYLPDDVDEGFAVKVGTNQFVVVLRGGWPCIPGRDEQHLLLLDRTGRRLDKLSCDISTRLTGDFRTDVPAVPEPDGARLVIRFIPPKRDDFSTEWSRWNHDITHQDKSYSFRWGNPDRPDDGPVADWAGKGLCRLTVRDGQFVILFPSMKLASSR